MKRRFGVVTHSAGTIVLLIPSVAMAHGIGGRLDLPVPLRYFVVGAGVVLVISFIALAVLWPEPRLQEGPRHEATRLTVAGAGSAHPRRDRPLPGDRAIDSTAIGPGNRSTRPTIAPVLVSVVFWLVVPFAGAVMGDSYTDIDRWRSLGRVFRVGHGERTGLLDNLGVWPAAILLVAFTWLELVSPNSGSPVTLGTAALVYTIGMMAAMAYAGREIGLAVSMPSPRTTGSSRRSRR